MKVEDVRFREVKVQPGASLQLYDADRRPVNVRIGPLKDRQKKKLMEALRTIRDRLRQPNDFGVDKQALCVAASFAAFVGTRHKAVVAYTATDPERPFIILNEQSTIWSNLKELAVTVLHELLHMLETMGCLKGAPLMETDKYAHSKAEAVHDLLCYYLLDFGVPSDHWALQKYPELRPKEEKQEGGKYGPNL